MWLRLERSAPSFARQDGDNVTTVIQNRARYPVNVRLPRDSRDNLDALRQVLVGGSDGRDAVSLGQLATVRVTAGPAVDLDDLYDRPIDSPTLKIATERILVQITDLLEGIRGGQAPAVRHDPKVSGQSDIGNFKKGRR